MGTITPNSTVYLLTGVPLDNTYENTIYFASTALQLAHFLNTGQSPFWDYQPRQITPLSYQRVNEGVLRVNLPYDQIYNCNYMMFQNTSYNAKWFYAFVLNVEYVNDQASNVYYELDVMQTWMLEAHIQPSYVEREHSETDNLDEHLELEDVPLGDIVCGDGDVTQDIFDDYCILVAYAEETEPEPEPETEPNEG